MTEIEHLTGIIDDAKAKLREAELDEQTRQLAENVHSIYKQFLGVGFTEAQAWELTIRCLKFR